MIMLQAEYHASSDNFSVRNGTMQANLGLGVAPDLLGRVENSFISHSPGFFAGQISPGITYHEFYPIFISAVMS
jgi:hypothetical protein